MSDFWGIVLGLVAVVVPLLLAGWWLGPDMRDALLTGGHTDPEPVVLHPALPHDR